MGYQPDWFLEQLKRSNNALRVEYTMATLDGPFPTQHSRNSIYAPYEISLRLFADLRRQALLHVAPELRHDHPLGVVFYITNIGHILLFSTFDADVSFFTVRGHVEPNVHLEPLPTVFQLTILIS